jgi:hypothetical protein
MELKKSYRTRSKKIHHWTQHELQAISTIWKTNFIRMDRNGICRRIRYWFHTKNNSCQHIPTTKAILAKIAICAAAATNRQQIFV